MKNQTRILISAALFMGLALKVLPQSIPAGNYSANDHYVNFEPDTSIYAVDPNGGPYYGFLSNEDTLLIDLNGDNIDDFGLIAKYSNGQQWYQRFSCRIDPLNQNNVSVSHYDSCFNYLPDPEFQYATAVVRSYLFGETISNEDMWIDSSAYLAHSDNDANYISCYFNAFGEEFAYAGLRVLKDNDTLYGWIRIVTPKYDSMLIAEYACNVSSTGIIRHTQGAGFDIYPNPGNGKFFIDCGSIPLQNAELDIFNCLGEKVYSSNINSSHMEINLDKKPEGIYFVRIKSGNMLMVRKIIIN